MNVECAQATLDEIKSAFRFNDAVLRDLTIARGEAEIGPSPLAKSKDDRDDERPPRRDASDDIDASESDEPVAETAEQSEEAAADSAGASEITS